MSSSHDEFDHLDVEDLLGVAAGVVDDLQVRDLGLLVLLRLGRA